MKKLIQIFLALVPFTAGLYADLPDPVSRNIETAVRIGETRLSYFVWDVYDISLYAEDGNYDVNKPFALQLSYLRNLKGKAIAKRSIEEMRRQGISEVKLAAWYTQLEKVFPDVNNGTELVGIFMPGKPTRFYRDGQFIGQVPDPEFGQPFANIWLGEQSSIPEIRDELFNGLAEE